MKPRSFDFFNNKLNIILEPTGLVLLDNIHAMHYDMVFGFKVLISKDYLFPFQSTIKELDDTKIPYCFRFHANDKTKFLLLPPEMKQHHSKETVALDLYSKAKALVKEATALQNRYSIDHSTSDIIPLMYAYGCEGRIIKELLETGLDVKVIISFLYLGFDYETITSMKNIPEDWVIRILKGET